MRRSSGWPTPTALAAARRAQRCGGMAGVDGRASNRRERGGGGEGNGTTLSARKRACRARRATSPRGIQPVGANESAARVGQVLEDVDQKLDSLGMAKTNRQCGNEASYRDDGEISRAPDSTTQSSRSSWGASC